MDMPIHLFILCGCFLDMMADFSGYNRDDIGY